MTPQRVEIRMVPDGFGTTVTIDGEPVNGLVAVSVKQTLRDLPVVTLRFLASEVVVVAEGAQVEVGS